MQILKTLALVALVAGCSAETQGNMRYILATYDKDSLKHYTIHDQSWRIFDNTDAGKMMITSSINQGVIEGSKRGLTYGLAKKKWREEAEFRPAAEAYLANKGCKPTGGRLLLDGQYEFDYSC
ncbi:hypothetical protein [Sagittula sp. S175]|uniref:hypothetical protein n=1 Tax=Sagittula sp. S175 TaxID=3415129 RepID=UPI003C7DCE09